MCQGPVEGREWIVGCLFLQMVPIANWDWYATIQDETKDLQRFKDDWRQRLGKKHTTHISLLRLKKFAGAFFLSWNFSKESCSCNCYLQCDR